MESEEVKKEVFGMSNNNNNQEEKEMDEGSEERDEVVVKIPPPPPPVVKAPQPEGKMNGGLGDEGKPPAKPKPDGHQNQSLSCSIFPPSPVSPAAERIRFMLGEDDDGPAPPQLFTELDELLSVDGQEMEWKETAR